MVQITQVEWLKSDDELNCPCCGARVRNGDGRIVDQPCEHFLFFWDGRLGGIEESSQSFDGVLDVSLPSEDCTLEKLAQVLNGSTGSDDVDRYSLLNSNFDVWQIEFRDHADGPVERTDYIAFDSLA